MLAQSGVRWRVRRDRDQPAIAGLTQPVNPQLVNLASLANRIPGRLICQIRYT